MSEEKSTGGGLRRLLAFLLAVVPVALVPITAELLRHRLPHRLPMHWNAADVVDATSSLTNSVTGYTIGASVGAVLAAVGVLPLGLRWRLRRWLITIGAAVAAFVAAIWLTTVSLSIDVLDPAQAPAPSWHVPALLIGVSGWTFAAYRACGPPPAAPAAAGRPAADLPRVPLPPGTGSWTAPAAVSRHGFWLLVPLLLLTALVAFWLNIWAASPALFAAALVGLTLVNRLSIDRTGIHIGFGPFGWPRLTVPAREIAGAVETTVRVAEWGGWGYRLHPDMRGRGLITGSGPGVRVELSGGRYLVASTRDAATVAGLVNTVADLVER
ncbi:MULTISPECIES: hypothetical protein [unclassified Solwaraspora]|uniref:hypothetical protein n=1 Tax=unclassified Solwaraspora TaxID=2627926 RepID=UPI00259BD6D0|nr:hypothetical protein [Solwaraspora sp. WMMA2056]WJK41964.1 hypothetical protein O7608_06075 [Solwaraspora sp. WMMA2056]